MTLSVIVEAKDTFTTCFNTNNILKRVVNRIKKLELSAEKIEAILFVGHDSERPTIRVGQVEIIVDT